MFPTSFDNMETLVSKTSGKFDTRKVTNRAEHSTLPAEFLRSLEAEGLTSEMLESYKLPLFRYHTQITLHGKFDGITTERVGHYKNLLLNQNGSLGVKYSAIDYAKKKQLGEWIGASGWYYSRSSTDDYYVESYDSKESAMADFNRIDLDGFWAKKYIMRDPRFGITRFYVLVYVSAVYEKDVKRLAEVIVGKKFPFILETYEMAQAAYKKREAQRKVEMEEQEARNKLALNAAITVANEELIPQIAHLPRWSNVYAPDTTLIATEIDDKKARFRVVLLSKTGGWYQAKGNLIDTPNQTIATNNYSWEMEKQSEKDPEMLVKRVRQKYKRKFRVLRGPAITHMTPEAEAAEAEAAEVARAAKAAATPATMATTPDPKIAIRARALVLLLRLRDR